MNDVLAICDLGHRFPWVDFDPDDAVIAAIAHCPEMVSKPEHAGLVMECGARVLWVRKFPEAKQPKRRRFRSKQLDLFYDQIDPLTNSSEDATLASEGHS